MSDMFSPAQALYLRLLRELQALGLQSGDHLPSETDLAARLGVGRPQVREALRMLEAIGTVRSRQGARRVWLGFRTSVFAQQLAVTLGPTPRSVAELLEVRQALETSLLPRAIALMTPAAIAELGRTADAMVRLAEAGLSFTHEDEEFHDLLLAPLGNELLEGLLSAFWSVFSAFSERHPPDEDPVPVARMHVRIVQAVRAGDAKLAVHELDAHFYGVRARLADVPTVDTLSPGEVASWARPVLS